MASEENTTTNKKLKIAVVDDSDFSRKTMISILEEAGYEVVGEANNAETAMQIAHTTSVDLFIIDVVMPEIGGIELLNHLREANDNIKAIMVSSLDLDNVIMDAIAAGATDYITKPFEKNDLLSSVSKIVQIIDKE